MNLHKYVDMAYMNSKGVQWITNLKRNDIWPKWVEKVKIVRKGDEDYAWQIVVDAVWYYGYSERKVAPLDIKFFMRNAYGEKIKGSNTATYSWEFIELDNFLETYVRPFVDP